LEDKLHLRPFCGSGLSSGMFLAFLFGAFGAVPRQEEIFNASTLNDYSRDVSALGCNSQDYRTY
jgi:hypothetical protein